MTRFEACSILGIEMNATPQQAKKRYRELAKKWHPDVCKEPVTKEVAQIQFIKINKAYETFTSDPFSITDSSYRDFGDLGEELSKIMEDLFVFMRCFEDYNDRGY